MSASLVLFPSRQRTAVLTCPVGGEWHVTTYRVGMGAVLLRRVFYNPHHACDLLSVLSRSHQVVIAAEAERYRSLMFYSRFDQMERP